MTTLFMEEEPKPTRFVVPCYEYGELRSRYSGSITSEGEVDGDWRWVEAEGAVALTRHEAEIVFKWAGKEWPGTTFCIEAAP